MSKWRGFMKESWEYMTPKGTKETARFVFRLPVAWIKFQFYTISDLLK